MLRGLGSPASGYAGVQTRAKAVLCSDLGSCGCGSCAILSSNFNSGVQALRLQRAATEGEPRDEPEVAEAEGGRAEAERAEPRREVESSRPRELSKADMRNLAKLRALDRQVRSHEQAHALAAGAYRTGAPRYVRVVGPDGKLYAIGGEVSIDTSSEGTPERTLRKMRVIRRAALAPSDPSAADMAVARVATQKEMNARQAIRARELEARKSQEIKAEAGSSSLRSRQSTSPENLASTAGAPSDQPDLDGLSPEGLDAHSAEPKGGRSKRANQTYRAFVTERWSSGGLVDATL